MQFWLITVAMVIMTVGVIALAVLRSRADETPPAAFDLQVYRDQLKEVDKDVARGVLTEADAERVRSEVSRRILAADAELKRQQSGQADTSRAPLLLLGLLGIGGLGAFGLYGNLGAPGYGDLALADRIERAAIARQERPDQAAAEASVPDVEAPPTSPDHVALVIKLREVLKERPNDAEGHRLLARSEASLGRFKAAHEAQERMIELLDGAATAADYLDYADMLILAAGSYVSPRAERTLDVVLSKDPQNGPARYYYGLMMAQTGRPDVAFRLWDALLREGPSNAPWIPPIVSQIEDMAIRAGINYQLPEIGPGRGPSADDINAAEDLSPADRMSMIEGMVGGLADRLATEGGPPGDWAQLITSLGVLGRLDQAAEIFAEAKQVFGANPSALDVINQAADRAGLQ